MTSTRFTTTLTAIMLNLTVASAMTAVAVASAPNDAQVHAEHDARMTVAAKALIQEQLDALPDTCTKTPSLTNTIYVINAAKDKKGNHQFDTTVLRKVDFDTALADAEAGRVYILRYCA